MRSIFGVPAHPLFVHFPTVLLPLAAFGVVAMVLRPAWHLRYRWVVLALGFFGAVGAVLAADAGETLQEQLVAKQGQAAASRWDDHVEAGDAARLFALLFFIFLAAYVLIPWFNQRRSSGDRVHTLPKLLSVSLAVLALVGAAGTVITVINAGHSGAKAVWCEVPNPPNCPTGG